jgi:cellulose 1,4-beta-cellobiosidase
MLVSARHHRPTYVVRNPYWRGTGKTCIETTRGAGFRVLRTPRPSYNVTAFPDIFSGCIWNFCSAQRTFPVRVKHIRHIYGTWHTRELAPGTWNAAFELWLGKKRMIMGHADGAELMIWINHHGQCCALAHDYKRVHIDGRTWLFSHWRARDRSVGLPYSGMKWNYIQFRLLHPRWKVNHLDLRKFVGASVRRGLIKPQWWIENVEAGFEIWKGGVGLATTKFRVSR